MATKVRCTLLRSVAEADFSVNDILELNAKYLHVCVCFVFVQRFVVSMCMCVCVFVSVCVNCELMMNI